LLFYHAKGTDKDHIEKVFLAEPFVIHDVFYVVKSLASFWVVDLTLYGVAVAERS